MIASIVSFILGIALICAGVAGIFKVKKGRFNRRNVAGIEEFKSYGHSVATQAWEKTLMIGSCIVLFFGVATFLSGFLLFSAPGH